MREPELCPVCRCAYIRETITDNGDMIFIHAEYEEDGVPQVRGCLITDKSEIRGIRMSDPD